MSSEHDRLLVQETVKNLAVVKDIPPTQELFKASRVVTGAELTTGIGLVIFAAVVPIATILWWGRPTLLADFVTLVFLGIYVFAVIATFAIIILWGLGRLELPDKFMDKLGVATIGEIAGLLLFMLKYLFRN